MYLPNVLLLRLMDFISIASVDCSEIVVFILKEPAHTVSKKMDKNERCKKSTDGQKIRTRHHSKWESNEARCSLCLEHFCA